MTNSQNRYNIPFTDNRRAAINVFRKRYYDRYDSVMIGKRLLEYGVAFNENCVHLLENYACDQSLTEDDIPDTENTFGNLLENPVQGQIWFNSTSDVRLPYVWSGNTWMAMGGQHLVVGISGVLMHGEVLPQPVANDGSIFAYDECAWIVTPRIFSGNITYIECYADESTTVNMRYKVEGSDDFVNGQVNYQIIGIRRNQNMGEVGCSIE